MMFYKDIAITALRLDELKRILEEENVDPVIYAEVLKVGYNNYRKNFGKFLIEVIEEDKLPGGNIEIVKNFVLNSTNLILPS